MYFAKVTRIQCVCINAFGF